MRKRNVVVSQVVAIGLLAVLWLWSANEPSLSQAAWIAPADGQARLEGKALYDMYCASCHGVNLEGQPDWRTRLANGKLPAPPHDVTGHTWHHPDQQLIEMTQLGFVGGLNAPPGYQSDMPAFKDILSEDQIKLILGYIKGSWPASALAAQKEITLQR